MLFYAPQNDRLKLHVCMKIEMIQLKQISSLGKKPLLFTISRKYLTILQNKLYNLESNRSRKGETSPVVPTKKDIEKISSKNKESFNLQAKSIYSP